MKTGYRYQVDETLILRKRNCDVAVRVVAQLHPNDVRYGEAVYTVEEVATGERYPAGEPSMRRPIFRRDRP